MKKSIILLYIGALAASCTAQNQTKTTTPPAPQRPPVSVQTSTTPIKTQVTKYQNLEFYTQNIGDISRNDNTVSYGSIVTAKPAGFKVVKTYFPAVAQNFRQKYLILHYTALNDEKSVQVLTQQAVSAHYLVNNLSDNEIYQLVDENKRAYHAGVSAWRKDKNLNDNSIGIEIVNQGYTVDSTQTRVFAPFEEHQFRKVASLVKDIVTRYNIAPQYVLAHSDIAPTRKHDPGPTFPWKRLYTEYQVGMWYDEAAVQQFLAANTPESFNSRVNTPGFITEVQTLLQKLGYDIVPTGGWNAENRKVVEAFQYHFRPEVYDGLIDRQTYAILKNLVDKYPQ